MLNIQPQQVEAAKKGVEPTTEGKKAEGGAAKTPPFPVMSTVNRATPIKVCLLSLLTSPSLCLSVYLS